MASVPAVRAVQELQAERLAVVAPERAEPATPARWVALPVVAG